MPIIRRWNPERLVEDMEELFGAEMQPYLSPCLEEEPNTDQENLMENQVPNTLVVDTSPTNKFWSRLKILFHSENW